MGVNTSMTSDESQDGLRHAQKDHGEHVSRQEPSPNEMIDEEVYDSRDEQSRPMLPSVNEATQREHLSIGSPPDRRPYHPSRVWAVAVKFLYWDLTIAESWTLAIVFVLYFSQGLIVGLFGGTVPILLKPHLDYADVGLLGLAFYPYSIKLLWSPLIDYYWSEKIGRRKSWIVPVQSVAGLLLIALGAQTSSMFREIEAHNKQALSQYVILCFCLIFCSATLGCAMEGWSITLLPASKARWTSTTKVVGMTMGVFTSYTLYILTTASRAEDASLSPGPEIESAMLGRFTIYIGLFNLLCSFISLIFIVELDQTPRIRASIVEVYKIIPRILRLRPVRQMAIVHLLTGFGFEVNDAGTDLKLLDKGFGSVNIAMATVVNLPFDLISSVIAGTLCVKYKPMVVWNWSFMSRLTAAMFAQFTVAVYPEGGVSAWYIGLVYFGHIFNVIS